MALVVCVAVPAAMAQKPPKQPKQVSISAVPNPVTFRDLVAISGKLTGPKGGGKQSIALREDPFPFGDLIELGTIFTDGQGNYSYGGRLVPINTRYQVRWGAVESEIVTVLARPRISLRVSDRTPAARSRVRLYGKVCTEHDGATLLIQRRVAPERWRTVGARRSRMHRQPSARPIRASFAFIATACSGQSSPRTPTTPPAAAPPDISTPTRTRRQRPGRAVSRTLTRPHARGHAPQRHTSPHTWQSLRLGVNSSPHWTQSFGFGTTRRPAL
jgi:hypothetical protein